MTSYVLDPTENIQIPATPGWSPLRDVVRGISPEEVEIEGPLVLLFEFGRAGRSIGGLALYNEQQVLFYTEGEKYRIFHLSPSWLDCIISEQKRFRENSGYDLDFGPNYDKRFSFVPKHTEKPFVFKRAYILLDAETEYIGMMNESKVNNPRNGDGVPDGSLEHFAKIL